MRKSNNGLVMPEGLFFYYLRVPAPASKKPRAPGKKPQRLFSRPLACICFGMWSPNLPHVPVWIRGISICSYSENFNKKEARRRAYARFLKAKGTRQSGDAVAVTRNNDDWTPQSVMDYVEMTAVDPNWPCNAGKIYKAGYDVQLTDKEKKIVEVAAARKAKKKEEATP